MIRNINDEYNQTLGSAKIAAILKQRGYPTDKKTVARLMYEMGLYSIRNGAKKTYVKEQRKQRIDLLNRDFTASAPNNV